MKIKSQPDFYAGLMFLVTGSAFAWGATNYTVGSGARMGPGYFPLLLGVMMAIVGIVIIFKTVTSESAEVEKIGKWAWRPLFYIITGNLAFGVLLAGLHSINLPAFGLMIAIYALTFIASMALPDWKFKRTFFLATALAVGSYLTFVMALKLQFPVWPDFIAG